MTRQENETTKGKPVADGVMADGGIVTDLAQAGGNGDGPVREIIGRVGSPVSVSMRAWQAAGQDFSRFYATVNSVDRTRPDYRFWDYFYNGKAASGKKGYPYAHLLARRWVETLTQYVMGLPPTVTIAPTRAGEQFSDETITYTNALLARFMAAARGTLIGAYKTSRRLGDAYLVVYADGSVREVSPDLVEPELDPLDHHHVVKYTITYRSDDVVMTDVFERGRRTLTLERGGVKSKNVWKYTWLEDMLPVVHWTCNRGGNEVYGRPVYESSLALFGKYDDLARKGVSGAEVMGNPVPVITTSDIDATLRAGQTQTLETYVDEDGNTQTRRRLRFDRTALMLVQSPGNFSFVAPPGGFTGDVRAMLKTIFYLIMEASQIPEYIWGGEMSSARASTDNQYAPFLQYIESLRREIEGVGSDPELGVTARGGLHELLEIWLRTRAATDARVAVAPLAIAWPDLVAANPAPRLKKIAYARGAGLITPATALALLDLVDDAESEIEAAQAEPEAEAARFEQQLARMSADRETSTEQEAGNERQTNNEQEGNERPGNEQ